MPSDSWCLLFALHCSGPVFPVPDLDVFGIGYRSQLLLRAVLQMPAALFMLSALKAWFPLLSK